MKRAPRSSPVCLPHDAHARSVAVAPPMPGHRRRGCRPLALPPFVRHARAADAPRFALGVASGQPRARRWCCGHGSPATDCRPMCRCAGSWRATSASSDIAARGSETAPSAGAHSVHAEPVGARAGALVLVPLRGTRPAQRGGPHAHRTGAGCRGAAALRARELPALRPRPLRRLAPHRARRDLDLVLFLGDYIYEYAVAADGACAARRRHGAHAATSTARATRSTRAIPRCRRRTRRCAVADGVGRPRGRQRLRRPAGPGAASRTSPRSAPPRTSAYWEHMPFPKSLRARAAPTCASTAAPTGARWRASTLLDDRQYRDPQACRAKPAAAARTPCALRDCPALRRSEASAARAEQERWLADGWDLRGPGTCWRSRR